MTKKAQMVQWTLDYNCTESQEQYLEYRYTDNQLQRILGDIEISDWDGRKERTFLGNLSKH